MSKFIDTILGHAIGDAMGLSTQGMKREDLLSSPVYQMNESIRFNEPAGSWSDDTSLEIATIDSYIHNKCFDYYDIMNNFSLWLNDGKYTPNGNTFDIGSTCEEAIRRFSFEISPLECGLKWITSCGNGSLMRMLPVALYAYAKNLKDDEIIKLTNEMSSLTHAHDICKLGCFIYVKFIMYILNGDKKEVAYKKIQNGNYSTYEIESIISYDRLLRYNIKELKIDDIKTSGYIVDTLECAIWIILNTDNFKDAIISSTNIGGDTDTIGAVTGSIAGAIYGLESAPPYWLATLRQKDYLTRLAIEFEESFNE